MISNWLTTLDALQLHMELQAKLVEQGRYGEVVAFAAPPDLPPLPRTLMARASELLERAQALTDRAGVLRNETVKRLAQTHRRSFVRRTAPVYIDQQA